ncbi:MAG: TldD/PmbA family protein, partial [Terriglobia bacterium]
MSAGELAALAERLIAQARAWGAEQSEVWIQESTQLSTTVRFGQVETLTEATSRSLALRVFVGQRVARASSSDLSWETLEALTRGAIARARLASEDAFAGLPDDSLPYAAAESLALYDPELKGVGAQEAIAQARETERIGLGVDPRVKNSSGASFGVSHGAVWGANSKGFRGWFRHSGASLSVQLLGQGDGDAAQVADFWYTAARTRSRLEPPEQVARVAVERVRRHFGARKIATQEVPVVLEPLVAAELLADIFGAVTGESVYLKQSFLAEARGERVASTRVTLVDDGLLPGGLGSRPFDREGTASRRTVVIEAGVLKNFLCSSYSARKLGLPATGNGAGDGEVPSNFYLLAGEAAPESILRSLERGLYVTRLMGQGVNLVTGDYSRGAFGLWVERGEIVHPVHEVTISGNLREMLAGVAEVG